MTAEVAIMNCAGVALAADSAVTVGNQKTYNSAVKLFPLSKVAPVAIMIYGNSTLSSVPWEVVIKEYRRTLGSRKFAKLDEYSQDFVSFLRKSTILFDETTEIKWLRDRVSLILNSVLKSTALQWEAEVEASKGAGLSGARAKQVLGATISRNKSAVERFEKLQIPRAISSKLRKTVGELTDQFGKDVLGDMYSEFSSKLKNLAFVSLTRSYFPEPLSGVVVAGYGEDEIFPSLQTLEFDGAIAGFVRYRVDLRRSQRITTEESATIVAYAQEDMVAAFMEGINPSVKKFLEETLKGVFEKMPEAFF